MHALRRAEDSAEVVEGKEDVHSPSWNAMSKRLNTKRLREGSRDWRRANGARLADQAETGAWQTPERIPRHNELVKYFSSNGRNWRSNGRWGGLNGNGGSGRTGKKSKITVLPMESEKTAIEGSQRKQCTETKGGRLKAFERTKNRALQVRLARGTRVG